MKHLFAFVIVAFSMVSLKAQITLEHTFESESISPSCFYTDTDMYYYKHVSNSLTIYNADYSIYKTVLIAPSAGFTNQSIYCASNKLFNSDDLIEFIVVSYNSSTVEYSMKLYNENQELIKDFGNRYYAWVVSKNNSTKLMITKTEYNALTQLQEYTCEVYALPGNPVSAPSEINSINNEQYAYPNPTSTTVMLPYHLNKGEMSTMQIFNSNGQLVEQKQIDCTFNKVMLNVEAYKPGFYIYKYKGVSKRFVVE